MANRVSQMRDSDAPLAALRRAVLSFRDARDWAQFHKPKDLALALSVEASELLELFRFKSDDEVRAELEAGSPDLAHEMADVLYWLLLLSHEAGVDLAAALEEKLVISGQRYPVELARGRKDKYTRLRRPVEPEPPPPEAPRPEAPAAVARPTLLAAESRRKVSLLRRRAGESSDETPAAPEDVGALGP